MPPRPGLSKNELEIARIVWEIGHATVRQVVNKLANSRSVDFSTVQTWLIRLQEKGYLNVRLDGRTKVYSPKVRPKTVIRETVDDLLNRLFSGDSMPLMQHLIEERGDISPNEISELRTLLNQLEDKAQDERKGGQS